MTLPGVQPSVPEGRVHEQNVVGIVTSENHFWTKCPEVSACVVERFPQQIPPMSSAFEPVNVGVETCGSFSVSSPKSGGTLENSGLHVGHAQAGWMSSSPSRCPRRQRRLEPRRDTAL
jgi:hypothetical protein